MDISDISMVASRKRMNTDAEKLREKVSHETAKIIKLKVAQDTAYWDLKEKLQQLESNHERLQQNMVEVQMQHEALSGQYQQELRLRPDTLNKLAGTRDICDVLEEYGERLRRTVARCRTDQQALSSAYSACGARVRRLASDAARASDVAVAHANNARVVNERHDADTRRLAVNAEQLGAARARCDILEEVRRELVERLDQYGAEIRRREEAAATLQSDLTRIQRELDSKNAELTRVVAAHEQELRTARARFEQEAMALREANEKANSLQGQLEVALRRIEALSADYMEATNTVEKLNMEIASLNKDKKDLELIMVDREQRVSNIETELSQAKERLSSLEVERQELITKLNEELQQSERQTNRVEELTRLVDTLRIEAERRHVDHVNQKLESTRLVEELRLTLTERERELDSKVETITRLMGDLKGEAEARARSEAALNTTRQQHEAERAASETARADLTATIQRLETTARAKDEEVAAQKTIIQEIRNDKDRLQERIRVMQSTINNIQQELTGRAAPPPPPPPPAPERERDAILYSYLSGGSEDSDALDAMEVNRRFEALARGDRTLPPLRIPRSHGSKKSLSQSKKESKLQSRKFFKNKIESKLNKVKE